MRGWGVKVVTRLGNLSWDLRCFVERLISLSVNGAKNEL